MEKAYSLAEAQQNFLVLLQQADTGQSVKIAGAGHDAVLLSEAHWLAIQKQLLAVTPPDKNQPREDLYKAWRWL